MKITDIIPEDEPLYFCCLEEWSDEMKEASDYKQKWYEFMKDKGLRVKFARDENNVIGGMIHYVPIEHSMFDGSNLYVVLCIWVHGHKQGRGDYRKRGMGKALLKAAEEDCRQLGTNGLVTWGLLIPVFMRASWFKRQGYDVIAKNGFMRLLWKPFTENAVPPHFMKPAKLPDKGTEKVNVTLLRNGWCPAQSVACERALKACSEFPGKVIIQEYDTKNRETVMEWGIHEGVYIDGKEVRTGPPTSYLKIRNKIDGRVKRLDSRKSVHQ